MASEGEQAPKKQKYRLTEEEIRFLLGPQPAGVCDDEVEDCSSDEEIIKESKALIRKCNAMNRSYYRRAAVIKDEIRRSYAEKGYYEFEDEDYLAKRTELKAWVDAEFAMAGLGKIRRRKSRRP